MGIRQIVIEDALKLCGGHFNAQVGVLGFWRLVFERRSKN